MRAPIGSTPLLLILFGGCFELPERVKDSAADDTGSADGECPPDSISASTSSVTIIDFVVNGRRLGPSASSLCTFAGGYGARLGLTDGDERGMVTVQSEELGAWGASDPAVEVQVSWEELGWSGSTFFTGSVVISEGGGDSGLGDAGLGDSGGYYVSFSGEATNGDDQQLILDVSWGG
jgi:hypothetical protein